MLSNSAWVSGVYSGARLLPNAEPDPPCTEEERATSKGNKALPKTAEAGQKAGASRIYPQRAKFARYNNLEDEKDRERTEQSFFVSKQEIVDNGYDLSINKYKKIEYVAVEYPPTQEILANLRKLSVQIDQEIAELEKLLNQ